MCVVHLARVADESKGFAVCYTFGLLAGGIVRGGKGVRDFRWLKGRC